MNRILKRIALIQKSINTQRIAAVQKIALLKHIALHGVNNRNQAILLINNEIILADNHPAALFKYLKKHNLLKQFVFEYYFTYYKDKLSNERIERMALQQVRLMEKHEYFNTQLKEAIWEYGTRNLTFTKIPIALGHYIKNIQGKEKVALIMPSITNMTFNNVMQCIVNKFPNAIVIDDETDQVLYTPNKNLKMDIEHSWLVTNINVLNFSYLTPLKTSIFNANLLTELAFIRGFQDCNIDYITNYNSFVLKINLILTNTNIADEDVAKNIYYAIQDAILATNEYFQENNINNYLQLNDRYTLQY